MDFDAQLYVSFKSSKYSMKNSEAVLFKGRFRTHVFQLSFFLFIYLFIDSYNVQGREQ